MRRTSAVQIAVAGGAVLILSAAGQRTGAPPSLAMGGAKSVTRFFVTSRGLGRGGNLGGLAGADAHCQTLAKAEGSGDHTWRAYLSTMATATTAAINARDRIGKGPWYNALGDLIAVNLDELHSGKNAIDAENAVTERGDPIRLETHDILTGSRADGTAFPGAGDLTCVNWTSSTNGRAQLGHPDRMGQEPRERSWNSAHASRGCSQQDLAATGGSGLFYCFAVD
jgi:hypothetical protein